MHRIGYSIAAPAARPPGRPCHPYERFCIAFQMRIIYRTRRTCALLEEGSAISVPHAGTPPDGGTGASKRTRSGPDKRIASDMVRCQQMLQEKISNGLINSYDAFCWAHPHIGASPREARSPPNFTKQVLNPDKALKELCASPMNKIISLSHNGLQRTWL